MLIARVTHRLSSHVLILLFGYLLASEFRRHKERPPQLMTRDDFLRNRVTRICCLEEDLEITEKIKTCYKENEFYIYTAKNITFTFLNISCNHPNPKCIFERKLMLLPWLLNTDLQNRFPWKSRLKSSVLKVIAINEVPLPIIEYSFIKSFRRKKYSIFLEPISILSVSQEHFKGACYNNTCINTLYFLFICQKCDVLCSKNCIDCVCVNDLCLQPYDIIHNLPVTDIRSLSSSFRNKNSNEKINNYFNNKPCLRHSKRINSNKAENFTVDSSSNNRTNKLSQYFQHLQKRELKESDVDPKILNPKSRNFKNKSNILFRTEEFFPEVKNAIKIKGFQLPYPFILSRDLSSVLRVPKINTILSRKVRQLMFGAGDYTNNKPVENKLLETFYDAKIHSSEEISSKNIPPKFGSNIPSFIDPTILTKFKFSDRNLNDATNKEKLNSFFPNPLNERISPIPTVEFKNPHGASITSKYLPNLNQIIPTLVNEVLIEDEKSLNTEISDENKKEFQTKNYPNDILITPQIPFINLPTQDLVLNHGLSTTILNDNDDITADDAFIMNEEKGTESSLINILPNVDVKTPDAKTDVDIFSVETEQDLVTISDFMPKTFVEQVTIVNMVPEQDKFPGDDEVLEDKSLFFTDMTSEFLTENFNLPKSSMNSFSTPLIIEEPRSELEVSQASDSDVFGPYSQTNGISTDYVSSNTDDPKSSESMDLSSENSRISTEITSDVRNFGSDNYFSETESFVSEDISTTDPDGTSSRENSFQSISYNDKSVSELVSDKVDDINIVEERGSFTLNFEETDALFSSEKSNPKITGVSYSSVPEVLDITEEFSIKFTSDGNILTREEPVGKNGMSSESNMYSESPNPAKEDFPTESVLFKSETEVTVTESKIYPSNTDANNFFTDFSAPTNNINEPIPSISEEVGITFEESLPSSKTTTVVQISDETKSGTKELLVTSEIDFSNSNISPQSVDQITSSKSDIFTTDGEYSDSNDATNIDEITTVKSSNEASESNSYLTSSEAVKGRSTNYDQTTSTEQMPLEEQESSNSINKKSTSQSNLYTSTEISDDVNRVIEKTMSTDKESSSMTKSYELNTNGFDMNSFTEYLLSTERKLSSENGYPINENDKDLNTEMIVPFSTKSTLDSFDEGSTNTENLQNSKKENTQPNDDSDLVSNKEPSLSPKGIFTTTDLDATSVVSEILQNEDDNFSSLSSSVSPDTSEFVDENVKSIDYISSSEKEYLSSSDVSNFFSVEEASVNTQDVFIHTEQNVSPVDPDSVNEDNIISSSISSDNDDSLDSVDKEFTETNYLSSSEKEYLMSSDNSISGEEESINTDEVLIRTDRDVSSIGSDDLFNEDDMLSSEYNVEEENDDTTDPQKEVIRTEREIIPSSFGGVSAGGDLSIGGGISGSDDSSSANSFSNLPNTETPNVETEITNVDTISGDELDPAVSSLIPEVVEVESSSEMTLESNIDLNADVSTEFKVKTTSQNVPLSTNSDRVTLSSSTNYPVSEDTSSNPDSLSSTDSEPIIYPVFGSDTMAPKPTTEENGENPEKNPIPSKSTSSTTDASPTTESSAAQNAEDLTSEKIPSSEEFKSTTRSSTSLKTTQKPTSSTEKMTSAAKTQEENTVRPSENSIIPFHFTIDADYDEVVNTRKKEFEESLTKQLVVAMRVPLECLQNLQVSKGSIEVNFELVPNADNGHLADEKALKAAAEELKRMIDNGQLTINDLNGNTVIVIPMDPPTTPPPVTQSEHTTLILGVVIGAFILTIISVVIAAIIIKRKANGGQRMTPIEEVRSKLPSYREIPFQEALFMKGSTRDKMMLGKYCYNTGQWLGPGPEPIAYQPPDSVVYTPPTDSEIRSTPRPPTAVRERLKNDWELDWDSMVFSR